MFIDLKQKRYLVTGASSGIGRQVAVDIAARGASVVVTGRDATKLEQTMARMQGGDHTAVSADLTSSDEIVRLVDQTLPLDGVVHCAGRTGLCPVKLLTVDFLRQVMSANFEAPVMLTQRLLSRAKIRNGGSVVFITSISAHTGTAGVAVYSASKAAISGLVRALALELAPKKIRLNCIAPGLVRTEMFPQEQQEWLDEQEKRYPLGLGKTTDVSNCVQFLLSSASAYMTGTSIIMDGGCQWI